MGREIAMNIDQLAKAKVLIVGGGVTGISVANILKEFGSEIYILDENSRLFSDSRYISIDDALEQKYDFVVVSPGWQPHHPILDQLRERGNSLLSEVDLAWKLKCEMRPNQKWLAVTGTNGKTTTVELTAAMLRSGGIKVGACGNVGETVLAAVFDEEEFDYLVVELSSFQLHWSDLPEFDASVILNIADDHTDWHGNFDEYIKSKMRILDRTKLAILNADDSTVLQATALWQGRKIFYSLQSPGPGEMGVVENLLIDRAFVTDVDEAEVICELGDIYPAAAHNVSNVLAASALARGAGVSHSAIHEAVRLFRPGRHRIELVGERGGIKWINDSKATNPHAAAASLRSIDSVIWIAGGLAKGASMHDLVVEASGHLKSAILIGKDRELIAHELQEYASHVLVIRIDPEVEGTQTLMEKIVIAAKELARSGDTVLMAPACASMDQFISYADRGDQFCSAVRKIVLT